MNERLFHILFLSCLKATQLIEKSRYFKLSWLERFRLKVHKRACKACNEYEKQSDILDKGISYITKQHNSNATVNVEELKSKIKMALDQNDIKKE
jgi:hypothetical protein